eukprot:jgi/Undpi1/2067/HiC_scaffold_12.g05453.m1
MQNRPECQGMIDDVLTSCLPVAAMAESAWTAGMENGQHSDSAIVDLPVPPNFSDMAVDNAEWDTPPYPKQLQLGSRTPSGRGFGVGGGSGGGGGGGGVVAGNSNRSSLGRRGSGAGFVAEKIGITRIPDRAWTIALDYLELGEGMRCRQLGRVFRDTVEASLSVLALSGVNSITWATPENLAFLTRFKNVRTLHCFGAILGDSALRVADCCPVRAWAFLLGALPKLEKVTLGDGTTSYVRSPGRGPGRDLFAAFKKNTCSKLKVLWLQRLDLWDDLESLASALAPAHCPVLEELFLDLALDSDDVERLAKCLHKFPACLKTLGVLAVAIKDRTSDGHFGIADLKPTLQLLADALSRHPRPNLQCLDISLHYEPDPNDVQAGEPPQEPEFKASTAVIPIMSLLESGKLTGLKHVQLSSCSLDDKGLAMACTSVASMKGIQTLDLSGNRLSVAGATELAKALCRCRSLHEIVLEESVDVKDAPLVSAVFKEFMPWATVRVEDRDSRKNAMARRSLAAAAAGGGGGQYFDADDDDDQGGFSDDEEGDDDSQNSDGGGVDTNHWDAVDAESDGTLSLSLDVVSR